MQPADEPKDERDYATLMCRNSPDFLVVVDRQRRFRWVNRLHEGLALEDVIGRPLETFETPDTHVRSRLATTRAFETGEPQTFESRATLPDGTEAWYLVRCIPMPDQPDRLLLVTTDITERKRAERERDAFQLRAFQGQKMEAIGRLAAGTAHDFNNLLTPIIGYTQSVQAMLDPDHPAQELLEGVCDAAGRAAGLSRELLTVGQETDRTLSSVDLGQAVLDMERMLRRVVPESVRLDISGVSAGSWVWADAGQLGQVLLNLVLNAVDAMPDGGELRILTRSDGDHTALVVEDTGVGMSAETIARVFEPFFTTKGTGGTGLGLATSHGIIEQSGGRFEVESALGVGSTFRVLLPHSDPPQ